jgi:hypothetical protein
MDAYTAYQLYSALKLHFTSSYDYHKYLGKVKWLNTTAAQEKFLRNKQRFFFHTLSRHEDPEGLCVSNMIRNPKIYIRDLLQPEAEEVWTRWQKRNQGLSYNFKQELDANDNWRHILKIKPSGIPFLLDRYIAGEISPETIVIIDSFGKMLEQWSHIDHPLVKQHIDSLLRYRSFVKFDKERCKKILLELSEAK